MKKVLVKKEELQKGYTLPISKKSIIKTLENMPEKDLEGLEAVIITQPTTNKDFNNYARYDPNQRTILLFAHYQHEDGTMLVGPLELTPSQLRKKITEEVLYHEVGHHVGIKKHNDESEIFAIKYSIKRNPNLKERLEKEIKEIEKDS